MTMTLNFQIKWTNRNQTKHYKIQVTKIEMKVRERLLDLINKNPNQNMTRLTDVRGWAYNNKDILNQWRLIVLWKI